MVAGDSGDVLAAAAEATASALAKAAAASEAAAKQRDEEAAVAAASLAAATGGSASESGSVRFFVRGLGKLGEHHLQDYFAKFGEVVDVSLLRDKKTQRPRGMAFVTLAPSKELASCDEIIDKMMEVQHKINGLELEVQEALQKPDAEDATAGTSDGPSAQSGIGAFPPTEEPPEEEVDMEAQAQAQAQWQMHYLAMAINASVPEVPAEEDPAPRGAAPKAQASPGGEADGSKGKGKGKGKGKVKSQKGLSKSGKSKEERWEHDRKFFPY